MKVRKGLAALAGGLASLAAYGACEVSLSETTLDFGSLHPPVGSLTWHSAPRTVQVAVVCEPASHPGFYLQGRAVGDQWSFAEGGLRVQLGESRLDGRPVTLVRQGGQGNGLDGPAADLKPDEAWTAGAPGRLLQVQLFIQASLPAQAWQARDQYQALGELLIRSLQ
jgi:hypothetical protein